MLVLLFISSPRFAPGFSLQSGLSCSFSAKVKGLKACRKIFFRTLQPKIAQTTVPPKPDRSGSGLSTCSYFFIVCLLVSQVCRKERRAGPKLSYSHRKLLSKKLH
jgi:hypothetical protein